jgi:hypothetical protein
MCIVIANSVKPKRWANAWIESASNSLPVDRLIPSSHAVAALTKTSLSESLMALHCASVSLVKSLSHHNTTCESSNRRTDQYPHSFSSSSLMGASKSGAI